MERRPTPAAWKKHRWKTAGVDEFRCVWQKSVILSILYDEQYIGTYTAGKTRTVEVGRANRALNAKEDWIRIADHHPAIISQALFDAVQKQLQTKGEPLRKREVGTATRYAAITSPLKGKVVCGHCGHTMRLSCTKNAAFHCWFTRSAPDAGCHKLRILARVLEEVVQESVLRQAHLVVSAEHNDAGDYRSGRQLECERQLHTLQEERQRLYEGLVLGDMDAEAYKKQKATLDEELARLQEIHAVICEQAERNVPSAASIKAAREALEAGVLTQELADLLISKVLVFPDDRIEIQWKISGFGISVPTGGSEPFVAV